jgi:hypothetical protein
MTLALDEIHKGTGDDHHSQDDTDKDDDLT